ncbi:MAG: hypothetical protein IJU87_04615 [Lachnospiraceae bacterium]|nr:hypothetical protein [Lachnospiraceae bacterium]
MKYKDRHIEEVIKRGDKSFKAILVAEERQTGKSTLLKISTVICLTVHLMILFW